MVFRKSDRPKGPFYVSPVLPGFGRVGPWSTGLRNKALALSVEHWLKEVAIVDPGTVRGIVEGHYTLREAYVAHKEQRLDELKERASDPPLREVVNRFRPKVSDRRLLEGLIMLENMAPKGARLSWLLRPKHISDLLADAVATGQKVNSIHRSLYAAIKAMLTYEVGKARKRAITTDVVFRMEDDTREVNLTPEEIRRLLDECDDQVRPVVLLAMLTGIDRHPLVRLTPSHIDFDTGELRVPDRKNKARWRTIEISSPAIALLRQQVAGRGAGEPIFDLTYAAVYSRFRTAREAAGLPTLRFKDLRHVFAGAWVSSGGTLKDLGGALGHTRASTTLRYTGLQANEARARMDSVAAKLGLTREHLKPIRGEGGA